MLTSLLHDISANSLRKDIISVLNWEDRALTSASPGKRLEFRRRRSFGSTNPGENLVEVCSKFKGAKVRRLSPSQAVTRWFLQGKCDLEEIFLQLYYGHLSMAGVEAIVSQLWGKEAIVLPEIISNLVPRLDHWLTRSIHGNFPYVFFHAAQISRTQSMDGAAIRVAVVAGIHEEGVREIIGIHVASSDSMHFWDSFLENLARRGLRPPQYVVGDIDKNLRSAVEQAWPSSRWLPFESNLDQELLRQVSFTDRHLVTDFIANFRASASEPEAKQKANEMAVVLETSGYSNLSRSLSAVLDEHFGYFAMPQAHRTELRKLEIVQTELNRLREQLRIIGPILEHQVIARFAAAGFRRVCRSSWSAKRVLSMS